MPSYVHTCAACGAALTVHERYFGRTLRCTSCGETFVAEPPDVPPETLVSEPPSADRPDRTGPVVLALTAAAVVVAALVWLGLPKTGSPFASLFQRQLFTGQIVAVRDGARSFAAVDRQAAPELVAASGASPDELERFASDSRCVALEPGTTVRVIEVRKRERVVVVRVLDGRWRDRKVWLPRAWLR